MSRILRIGGASGAWGDSVRGPIQLAPGRMDVCFLAEMTMSRFSAPRGAKTESHEA